MVWMMMLACLVAGAPIPVQAGVNANLSRQALSHPVLAALVSFAVGTVALLCVALAMRLPLSNLQKISSTPLWMWTGGFLGAFLVTATVVVAPRLGASVMLALLVASQMLASVLMDHFGVLGYPQHTATPGRLLGAALIVVGVLLIRRF